MNRKRLASWLAGLVLAIPLLASPPAVNADYATCMYACQHDGGSEADCHQVCRRE